MSGLHQLLRVCLGEEKELPGASVTTYNDERTESFVVVYHIPMRSLVRFRHQSDMVNAITKASPRDALDREKRNTERARRMAIGKFRLGKFGRP